MNKLSSFALPREPVSALSASLNIALKDEHLAAVPHAPGRRLLRSHPGIRVLSLLAATFTFAIAAAATAHAGIITDPWTISSKGGKLPITVTVTLQNGATYEGTTDVAPTNTDVLNLVNGNLKNTVSGQPINLGAKIVGGEVSIPNDNIKGVKANGSVVGFVNVAAQGFGNWGLGGILIGLDQSGNAAIYEFGVGYGDETGTPTWLADVILTATAVNPLTFANLLSLAYVDLEAQLPSALQGDLTLNLAGNSLNFAFPASIQDPSIVAYSTDTGLSFTAALTAVPEPASFILMGAALLAIGAIHCRRAA